MKKCIPTTLIIFLIAGISAYAIPTTGLVSRWAAEGNANDSVGSNHGAINGATFNPGVSGQAFQFDGIDDSVNLSSSLLNGLSQVTISAWFNVNELRRQSIFAALKMGVIWQFGLELTEDGSGRLHMLTSSTPTIYTQDSVTTGDWYHVAAVFKSGTSGYTKIFLNGIEQASYSGNLNVLCSNPGTAKIGASDQGTLLNGKIDDVLFYNVALSGGEILQIYNESVVPEAHTGILIIVGLFFFLFPCNSLAWHNREPGFARVSPFK